MTPRMCASRLIAPSVLWLMSLGCSSMGGALGGEAPGGVSGISGAPNAGGSPLARGGGSGEGGASNVSPIMVEGVSTWRGNATAAYSIIHDDACDYILDSLFTVAEPALTARGLRAGFGAIVERCAERDVWDKLEVMVAHGHEILCHSWDHQDFVAAVPPADLSVEIDQATSVLAAHLPDQKLEYFIFPFDSFTQPMVDHLVEVGYSGARAGTKGVNPPDFKDPMRGEFDVYNDENSIYYPEFSDVMKAYVDDAISKGGWAIREFHGIQDSSWQAVPTADYEAHLDYIKAKVDAGELWVDTPSAVSHYRFARQYCGIPTITGAVLRFDEPNPQCLANATPLSVILTSSADEPSLTAMQAGKSLGVKRLGAERYLVDVDPTLGEVTLAE